MQIMQNHCMPIAVHRFCAHVFHLSLPDWSKYVETALHLRVTPATFAEQLVQELRGHVKDAASSPHANYVLQKAALLGEPWERWQIFA